MGSGTILNSCEDSAPFMNPLKIGGRLESMKREVPPPKVGMVHMDNIERLKAIEKSPISFEGLRKLNIIAGSLHFIQGIIMVFLGFLLTWVIYTFYSR